MNKLMQAIEDAKTALNVATASGDADAIKSANEKLAAAKAALDAAKEGEAIQLTGAGLLYDTDFANAKIYIKNGNTISASSFSAITTSVSAANNILYHTTAGTIDLVIFSADGKAVTK